VAIDQVWWLQQVRLRLLACRLVTSIHLNRIARLISGSESLNDRHGPKTNREGQMTGVDTYRVATPIIGRHLSPMIHLQNQASPGAQTLIDLADQTKNPKTRALPSTASSKPTRTRRQLGLIGGASFSGYGKYSKNRVQNELSTR
jgi:hypothetical protein